MRECVQARHWPRERSPDRPALTEEQYGKENRALVNPLTNLGTVHYRLKDFESAEKEYQRSIEILEATGTAEGFARRLTVCAVPQW